MDFFARDQNEAEQGLGVPLGDLPSSSQPSVARMSTALHPSVAPSMAPSMDGIDERLSGDDTVSESLLDEEKIRRKGEFHKYAKGWPRFAAVHDGQHNASMYRRFGDLLSRFLVYKQGRLDNLQQQVEEYENNPATDNIELTAGQTRKVGQPYDPDHLDLIMEEFEKELVRYYELLLLDRNTQALIPAYQEEVRILYDRMASEGIVGGAGTQAAYHIDDFVFTRPKLVHKGFRGLINSRLGKYLTQRIFSDRQISSAGFSRALQVLVVLYILFMLLTPAALIYLRELDKAGSFGVVVVFSVVFCGSLVAAHTSFERFLIGTCTYATILLTTLLQTQFVGRSSSP